MSATKPNWGAFHLSHYNLIKGFETSIFLSPTDVSGLGSQIKNNIFLYNRNPKVKAAWEKYKKAQLHMARYHQVWEQREWNCQRQERRENILENNHPQGNRTIYTCVY